MVKNWCQVCLLYFLLTQLQQIKALLQSVGTSFCPNYTDWFVKEGGDAHSRNDDRSVVSKFLQSHPADYSTTKLQVLLQSAKMFYFA
jgi:hypothetical protein